MNIGIDIDGVLANSAPIYCEAINELFNKKLKPSDIIDYNLKKIFLIDDNEFSEFMNYLFENKKWLKISTSEYANEFINKIKNFSKVFIVTSRPLNLKDLTIEWLNNNNIYYDELIFCNSFEKFKFCSNKGYNFSWFIDDCPEIINCFNNNNVNSIIMNAFWNENIKFHKNIKRVYNLKEAYELIFKR